MFIWWSSWDVMSFSLAGRYQHFEGNYSLHHLPWRWRKQVPPISCYSSTNLHSATFQKCAILIFTSVWTSHLKGYVLCNGQNHVYKNWIPNERSKHPTDLTHWVGFDCVLGYCLQKKLGLFHLSEFLQISGSYSEGLEHETSPNIFRTTWTFLILIKLMRERLC